MNKYTLEVGGRTLTAKINSLAKKANGEVLLQYGDTVVMATATMDREDTFKDFFPLSVNYEEKFYAAGKIGGSRYTRREGRPSDRATLISRMIDRAIRPMFPKELKKEIQVIVTCLSWDEENDPGVLGMIAASLALHISSIPWNGPLGAVRVGKNNGELLINPVSNDRDEGEIDLILSGLKKKETIINMIEGGFEEEKEDTIMEAVEFAEKTLEESCSWQEEIASKEGAEKKEINPLYSNEAVEKEIKEKAEKKVEKIFSSEENPLEKTKELKEEIMSQLEHEDEDKKYASLCFDEIVEKAVKDNILFKEKRVDGRKINQLRDISIETDILPRTHGSAIFSRGETKSLSIITLGAPGDQQLFDDMELTGKKRFMHHYNFPAYSVGEVKPIRGPSRRDIGHGMLGEKALLPLIPDTDDFLYTIRAVSEILTSNGSTSMASVCSTTAALMDAGVPIKRPVAGISIGLITKDDEYKLITDIQGAEDHYGDMDFKVAGTEEGVTAIQMDVKVDGITKKMMKEALQQAKETRLYIIEEIRKVIDKPKEDLSPYAPRVIMVKIEPSKIGEVIGPKGKTINKIIEETDSSIDIEDDGRIFIVSKDKESAEKAMNQIKDITREVEVGEVFEGEVKKLFDFGAVVEILPGHEGLVHISEIADERIDKVEDRVKLGDQVKVKVIKIDGGKMSLSIKRANAKE